MLTSISHLESSHQPGWWGTALDRLNPQRYSPLNEHSPRSMIVAMGWPWRKHISSWWKSFSKHLLAAKQPTNILVGNICYQIVVDNTYWPNAICTYLCHVLIVNIFWSTTINTPILIVGHYQLMMADDGRNISRKPPSLMVSQPSNCSVLFLVRSTFVIYCQPHYEFAKYTQTNASQTLSNHYPTINHLTIHQPLKK